MEAIKNIKDVRIELIQPVLSVRNMRESRKFYVDILGFKETDWGTDEFTMLSKDGGSFYLCQGGQGNPGTWMWIGFDGDIHAFHQRLVDSGVKIKLPPTNFYWAYEMQVFDPDGHVLRIGTDPDPSKPFADGW